MYPTGEDMRRIHSSPEILTGFELMTYVLQGESSTTMPPNHHVVYMFPGDIYMAMLMMITCAKNSYNNIKNSL